MFPRLIAAGLTSAAVFWAAALLLVPTLHSDRPGPPGFSALAYAGAALVCHQRPERSFHIQESRVPVCARCMGLYISGALGALIAWPGAARVPRHARALLIGAALPTVVSVATEWAGIAASSNILRAALALPLGGMAGWVFVRMLRAEGEAEQMRYDLLV